MSKKLNFVIASFWSDSMRELASLTWPNKVEYANRNGYQPLFSLHPSGADIMWDRPRQWADMLDQAPDGTHCLFLGCDTLITRPDLKLEQWITDEHDAHVLVDNSVVFGDVHCWRACDKTRTFMRSIATRTNIYSKYNGTEQDAFTSALSASSFREYQIKVGNDFGTHQFYARAAELLNSTNIKVKLLNLTNFAGDDPALWLDLPPHYAWSWNHLILHMGGLESAGNLANRQNTRLMLVPRYLEEITKQQAQVYAKII